MNEDGYEGAKRDRERVRHHRRVPKTMGPARHPDHDAEDVRKRRKKDAVPGHDCDGDETARDARVADDAKHHWPTDDGADCRAIACRALLHYELKKKTIANLTKLILKPCIRIPMAPSQMDADHVRISALLLLREWARKGNPAAVKACSSIMDELNQAKDDSELRTPEFDEYRRQMEAVFQGKKVRPKEIKPIRLNFTTAPAPAEK